jgi:hypothetical protein
MAPLSVGISRTGCERNGSRLGWHTNGRLSFTACEIDENLPNGLAGALSGLGHDVDTVIDEGLAAKNDDTVWRAATRALQLGPEPFEPSGYCVSYVFGYSCLVELDAVLLT